MNKSFDEMLKKKARNEPVNIPRGFEERLSRLMAELPERRRPGIKKIFGKVLLALALLLGAVGVSAAASPYVAQMAGGMISYFQAPQEFKYLSRQTEFEKYNSAVGVSVSDQGIELTLDNIAVDDNYIVIFYTIRSEKEIELKGDEDIPLPWRTQFTAPYFWFKNNGRYIDPPAQGEVEAYLENEFTLKGMQRFAVMDTLADNFNLELYTEEIFDTPGQWHIAVSVDKSKVAAESLTVEPKIKARVTSDWQKERSHKITVEKVSISPFGSQIVLSERAKNTFDQFVLRDDKGNYLTVIPAATFGGSFLRKAANSFEFIGGSTETKELTLIPIVSGSDDDDLPRPERKAAEIGNYPLYMPASQLGGYVLDSLEITEEKAVATLHQKGAVEIITPSLMLLDEKEEYLDFAAYQDVDYDRETGEIIITQYFRDVSPEDLSRIKKIGYFYRAVRLNEDEAVVIPLK